MMKHLTLKAFLLCVATALFVSGCGGAIINAGIGGAVTGLSGGASVGLLDNGADALTVNTDGNFTFATHIEAGSTYNVTVSTEPIGETCIVTNGVGTVEQSSGNITSVSVNCVATVSANNILVGTVSGLAANNSVTLLNNGTDSKTMTSNGSFAFNNPLAVGASYNVVVEKLKLPGQHCVVSNGAGVIQATGSIAPVTVTCS